MMMFFCTRILLVSLLLVLSLNIRAQTGVGQCQKDLEFIPTFLLENDAGGKDHLQKIGKGKLDAAYRETEKLINDISSASECDTLLKSYLLNWRKDHINIRSTRPSNDQEITITQSSKVSFEPKLELLSDKTALLVLPSFRSSYKSSIETLLIENESELEQRLAWIIDVRRNGGGSDASYEALLPWFISNEVLNIDTSWLVTPINVKANASICLIAAPNDPSCTDMMDSVVGLMRSTKNGEFTQSPTPHSYQKINSRESAAKRRVAVLMDDKCGSSCEQFLLTVRQSFNVKLLGRNSAGALDYSNLRPYPLPSGERDLIYAVSRSHRLPFMPVDLSGVMPDILLPKPQDKAAEALEVMSVQNWLEGGSLEVGKTKQ